MRQLHTNKKFDKPPKLRFRPGQWFMYDGEPHVIKYVYRVENEPHVWYHCLENEPLPDMADFNRLCQAVLPQGPSNLVESRPFRDHHSASQHFANVYCYGNFRTTKNTQELLKLKQVVKS